LAARGIGVTRPSRKSSTLARPNALFRYLVCLLTACETPKNFLEPENSSFWTPRIIPLEDIDTGAEMPTFVLSLVSTHEEVVELKKFVLLASVVAIVVAALALPAVAGERWDNNNWWENHDNNKWWKNYDDNNWWDNGNWWDHNDWWKDHSDRNDDDDRNDANKAAPVITQEFDQEAESGDVDQSFNVSNTGDNSNQCAGIQGVANTGNAQNQISVLQNGSEADDFSFEDSGSSIEVSPTNSTSCDQEVNQAASAYYGGKW
jgi:hypothetical protein